MLDLLALQIILRAAEIAGNDRELPVRGVVFQVRFLDVGERTNNDVLTVIGNQFRRHRLHLAAEKHVEKKRVDDVIAMMSERNLGRADFGGDTINHAAPQPRTERTHGLAFRDYALHGRVGVLFLDVKGNVQRLQITGKNVLGITGVFLVEIEGEQLEWYRRFFAQLHQDIEHPVAVLTAG